MNLPYNIQDVEKYGTSTKPATQSRFGGGRRRNSIYFNHSFLSTISGRHKDGGKHLDHVYPLIVFSKTYCPYSRKAKAILDSFDYSSPYHIVEVDLRDDGDKVKQALGEISGRYTFPNVFVHGTSIGGASEIESMHQQDQLTALLRSEGIIA
ncbi:unnamed protein product [Absidia cylindrospora]